MIYIWLNETGERYMAYKIEPKFIESVVPKEQTIKRNKEVF